MTKSQLIEAVYEKTKVLTKNQVDAIVSFVFDGMKEALSKGDKIEVRGFGNFRVKLKKAKTGRNPRTNESVEVPAKNKVHFKIGKPLHYRLNTSDKK
jgi:integration host factor subunit beta